MKVDFLSTFVLVLMIGGCANPSTPQMRVPFTARYADQPFTYKILESTTVKQGHPVETYYIEGEDAHELGHFLPDSTYVGFEFLALPFDLSRLLVDYSAVLVKEMGGLMFPFGPRTSQAVTIKFNTDNIRVDDFEALAYRRGHRGPYVFSSVKAVKVFRQVLSISENKNHYRISHVGFDSLDEPYGD